MEEIEQLRTELANVKAALATAEKMLDERDDAPATFEIKSLASRRIRFHGTAGSLLDEAKTATRDEVIAAGLRALSDRNGPAEVSIMYRANQLVADAKDAGLEVFIMKDGVQVNGTYDRETGQRKEPTVIGMDMAKGTDASVMCEVRDGVIAGVHVPADAELPQQFVFEGDKLEPIVNGIHKHAKSIIAEQAPRTIERRKVNWPEPGKMDFDLERTYDPMNMKNREGPLRLREEDSPRRRRTDRHDED